MADNRKLKRQENLIAWLFIAPLVLIMASLIIYPFFKAIWMSVNEWRVGSGAKGFVGLQNYINVSKNFLFQKAFGNTMMWAFFSVIVKLFLGMLLAMILNQKFKFSKLIRGLVLVPWIIPTTISALVWVWIFNDMGGALNEILMALHIIRRPVAWLGKASLARASVISVNIWRGTPYFAITLLAGLKNIPRDRYEAAAIDGANRIQSFLHITMPGLRHVLFISTLLETIWAIGDFGIVYKMTKGGPAGATHLLSTLTYEFGFLSGDLGQAVAVSLIILPVLALLVIAVTRQMDKEVE